MDPNDALAKAPLFVEFERDVLAYIARSARTVRFASGDLLVREGEEAASFLLLLTGGAEIVRNLGEDGELVVGGLTEGEFFGEMALLDGFPRSASVRATSDCECLVLERKQFLDLITARPDAALAVLRVLSHRLRDCEDRLLP